MQQLAVVQRDFEEGGEPENVEDLVKVLDAKPRQIYLSKSFQTVWTLTLLVEVK